MNKLFVAMGLFVGVTILLISVVRASGEAASSVLIEDENRVGGGVTKTNSATEDTNRIWLLPGSFWHGMYVGAENVRVRLMLSRERKAEMYLKYADERLNWTETLSERQEYGSAIMTITKGIRYLSMAVDELIVSDSVENQTDAYALSLLYESSLEQLSKHAEGKEKDLLTQLQTELLMTRSRVLVE